MFKPYIRAELIIFTKLKKYFEKLPAVGTDEYYNAFYDIVAQYINGGNEYLVAGELFDDAIVARAEIIYEQLSKTFQRHIIEHYESSMHYNDFDEVSNEKVYNYDEIYHLIMGRFKAWVDDTFDEEYLEDGYIDEEKYIEADYEEDDGDEYEEEDISEVAVASNKKNN